MSAFPVQRRRFAFLLAHSHFHNVLHGLSLPVLFSAPFGFGQALLPTEAPTTAPARSGRPGGALLPASSGIRALPPFWQLAGFAVFYAGGGYMIKEGDSLNGSGTITGECIAVSSREEILWSALLPIDGTLPGRTVARS